MSDEHKRLTTTNYLITIFFWLILVLLTRPAQAQQVADDWLPLQQVPGFLDDTFTPVMVVDRNKTVHAFASQWVGNEFPQRAIFYSQWSSFSDWTTPIDIILPPMGETEVYDAYLSESGIIHLLFRSGTALGSSIYYSRAPIVRADRATAWSSPELIGPAALVPGSGAIIGDDGNLVVIFTGGLEGNNGVYAVVSSDEGVSWTDPEPIYLTFDTALIPYSLHMAAGQNGQAHAVWNVVNEGGVDQELYYARLEISQAVWTSPTLLAERISRDGFFGPSFPVLVDNGREVVVMYNSGNPVANGQVSLGAPVQLVRRSEDGGDSWQPETAPFPRHLGRSGSHALVVDSEQVIHALFIQRVEPPDGTPVGGLWHSRSQDGEWSEPELFDLNTFSGHDLRAVVSQGNLILATMREDPGAGAIGVWYTSIMLNSAELPVVIPDLVSLEPTPTVAITSVPVLGPATPQPSPVAGSALPPNSAADASSDPARAVMLALGPVFVLLVGVIIVRQLSRLRR